MYKKLAKDRLSAAKKAHCENKVDTLVVGISVLLDSVSPEEALKAIGAIMDIADHLTPDRNTFVVNDSYCNHLGWQTKKRWKGNAK